MAHEMRRDLLRATGFGIVLITLLIFSFLSVAYRDWAFICENTGSRKGYREWFFGLKTGPWFKPTSVETFIAKEQPDALQHRWTSYAGTGRNIYGVKLLFGHGSPGVILQIPPDYLNSAFDALPASEKKAFYQLLLQGDKKALLDKVAAMQEAQTPTVSKNPQ